MTTQIIRDAEQKVIKFISKLEKPQRAYHLSHIFGPSMALEISGWLQEWELVELSGVTEMMAALRPELSDADHLDLAQDLVGWAYDEIAQTEQLRLDTKSQQYQAKASNRALYLHEYTLNFGECVRESGEVVTRWSYDTDLRAAGLVSRIVHHLHGPQAQPTCIPVVNMLPPDEDGFQEPIPAEEMDKLNRHGLAVSGGRLAWNLSSPGWKMLTTAFPNAIDMSGYNHSFNAPLMPNGYLPEVQVQFKRLTHPETGEDLLADGSGLYHPECEAMKPFVAQHGRIIVQFRAICPTTGLVAKGILCPSTQSVDEHGVPCITCDWIQVKGLHKAQAKANRADNKISQQPMHLGVIGAWSKPGVLTACFELIENLQCTERVKEILRRRVDKALAKLVRDGVQGLFAQVARTDDRIKLIGQFLTALELEGLPVSPTRIQMIRAAIEDKLGRVLWDIANGAGIAFKRYVCRLDATVPKGHVVVSGLRAGQKIATFRFPLVLSQGVVVLKTINPDKHLLCDEEEVPFQAVFNPADLTTKMQGDDDGDIVGISNDPEMVELFEARDDANIYHIEPKGIAKYIPVESPEGLRFLQNDPRGQVGRCTVCRSRLKAIGDIEGANAMSIAIQENIDCAKRAVEWSDIMVASNLDNWNQDENGEYHFTRRFSGETAINGQFPMDDVAKWVGGRCQWMASVSGKKVLGWRQSDKKISISNWQTTFERTGWDGGNLVHYVHDYAHAQWQKISELFEMQEDTMALADIVPLLLRRKGVNISLDFPEWEDYRDGLRLKAGLVDFGKEIKKAQQQKHNAERKYELIDQASDNLVSKLKGLTLQELATVWALECSNDRENNAFRAIAWIGSPVLQMLGIEQQRGCDFATNDYLQKCVEWCLSQPNPYTALSTNVYKSTKHTDYTKGAVQLHECPKCLEALQTALVREIRNRRKLAEHAWMRQQTSRINGVSAG